MRFLGVGLRARAVWAALTTMVMACAPSGTGSPHTVLQSDAEPLRTAFNRDSGKVRVLMLVSPTCGACLRGASEVERALLAANADPRLRAYVVWVPKLAGHERDVPIATRFVPDSRATHYWDESAGLVHGYDAVLSLGEDAWDVYMVYGPDARWPGATPPAPDFWMHQLGSPLHPRVHGPVLDPAVFAAHADSLLRRPERAG